MSKPSERKRLKKLARQKADAKAKYLRRERQTYARNYPTYQFHEKGAPPEFVALVRKGLNDIDFRNGSLFSQSETRLFKDVKQDAARVLPVLQRMVDEHNLNALDFTTKLGRILFDGIPKTELLKWIPHNDVQIVLGGPRIHVHFRSLRQQKAPGGTIYYSRHKPTLLIDGQPKIIGFSRHAIEQTCRRLGPRWFTYLGLGDVFALFDQCRYFEPCTLHDGQLAFTFYDKCAPGFFNNRYAKEVLGETADAGRYTYYRVGYCPAAVDGDFVKAITLLFPGYRNTPEFDAILQAPIPDDERHRLIEQTEGFTIDTLQQTHDFSLIKFFHDQGVPQVIQSDKDFYGPAV